MQHLRFKFPTLAVAVTDELVLFAYKAQQVFAALPVGDPLHEALMPSQLEWKGIEEEDAIRQQLNTDAIGIAASRLYIAEAVLGPVCFLADLHLSAGTAGLPVTVDTHRSPVTLSRIAAQSVLFRPTILLRGLAAHIMAEAMLNAPQVLGSLQLLLNPTGLVRSFQRGMADLIGLPLAGIQERSPTMFFAGIGQGSVSLVKEISGWTFTSIGGFSNAVSRALDSSGAVMSVVGAPVSGALGIVGAISSGLAEGLNPQAQPRRLARDTSSGSSQGINRIAATRLMRHESLLRQAHYLTHVMAKDVTIHQGTRSLNDATSIASFLLQSPMLLLTSEALIVFSEHGATPVLVMDTKEAEMGEYGAAKELRLFSPRAAPANNITAEAGATIVCHLADRAWLSLMPLLWKLKSQRGLLANHA